MKLSILIGGVRLGLVFSLGLLGEAAKAVPPLLDAPAALFEDVNAFLAFEASAPASSMQTPVRTRPVVVNTSVLSGMKPGKTNRVLLPMFPDLEYTANFTGTGLRQGSFTSWRGNLEGLQNSFVSVVFQADVLLMQVYDGRGSMSLVRPQAGGGHLVEEMGADTQSRCGEATARLTSKVSRTVAAMPKSAAADTYVDILLLYTPAARTAAGGHAAVQASGLNFINHANWVHERSDTHVRFRLVGLEEIAVAFDDNYSQYDLLPWLVIPDDGNMDSAIPRRDELGADLVCLLANGLSSGSRAYQDHWASTVNWNDDPNGFVHATGHNLGCAHEDAESGYNRGYQRTESYYVDFNARLICRETRQTVMAAGFNSGWRTDYFSNPNILFRFSCTESSGGDMDLPLGVPNSSDNARYLRENRSTTASFRQSVFYLSTTGVPGAATSSSPGNSITNIYSEWLPKTEGNPGTVRAAAGSYGGVTRLEHPIRIEQSGAGGSVRITQ